MLVILWRRCSQECISHSSVLKNLAPHLQATHRAQGYASVFHEIFLDLGLLIVK